MAAAVSGSGHGVGMDVRADRLAFLQQQLAALITTRNDVNKKQAGALAAAQRTIEQVLKDKSELLTEVEGMHGRLQATAAELKASKVEGREQVRLLHLQLEAQAKTHHSMLRTIAELAALPGTAPQGPDTSTCTPTSALPAFVREQQADGNATDAAADTATVTTVDEDCGGGSCDVGDGDGTAGQDSVAELLLTTKHLYALATSRVRQMMAQLDVDATAAADGQMGGGVGEGQYAKLVLQLEEQVAAQANTHRERLWRIVQLCQERERAGADRDDDVAGRGGPRVLDRTAAEDMTEMDLFDLALQHVSPRVSVWWFPMYTINNKNI